MFTAALLMLCDGAASAEAIEWPSYQDQRSIRPNTEPNERVPVRQFRGFEVVRRISSE